MKNQHRRKLNSTSAHVSSSQWTGDIREDLVILFHQVPNSSSGLPSLAKSKNTLPTTRKTNQWISDTINSPRSYSSSLVWITCFVLRLIFQMKGMGTTATTEQTRKITCIENHSENLTSSKSGVLILFQTIWIYVETIHVKHVPSFHRHVFF